MGPIGRDAIRRNQEAVEAARNRPAQVDPKHKREEVGQLREKLERPEPKPTQTMPGYGSPAQGQIATPRNQRYGDPNYGDQAVGKARQEREQQQAQKQQQKQER